MPNAHDAAPDDDNVTLAVTAANDNAADDADAKKQINLSARHATQA